MTDNKSTCKVLLAPHMLITGVVPSWGVMLNVVAEAINTARSDGVVQIMQNISVVSNNDDEKGGGEDEEEIEPSKKLETVKNSYNELISSFDSQHPLRLQDVRSRADDLYVITIVVDTPIGDRC